MSEQIKGRHIWIKPDDWGEFKRVVSAIFKEEISLDGFEVILFSSEEQKDNLVGKRIELKP